MAFAYVTGLAGDKTIDLSDDNKRMLEKIEGDDKSDFADIYNRIITYNELGINKSSKDIINLIALIKITFTKEEYILQCQMLNVVC